MKFNCRFAVNITDYHWIKGEMLFWNKKRGHHITMVATLFHVVMWYYLREQRSAYLLLLQLLAQISREKQISFRRQHHVTEFLWLALTDFSPQSLCRFIKKYRHPLATFLAFQNSIFKTEIGTFVFPENGKIWKKLYLVVAAARAAKLCFGQSKARGATSATILTSYWSENANRQKNFFSDTLLNKSGDDGITRVSCSALKKQLRFASFWKPTGNEPFTQETQY